MQQTFVTRFSSIEANRMAWRPSIEAEFRTTPFTLRRTRYPAGIVQPPHWHERPQVTLMLQGSIKETVEQNTRKGHPLSVVFKPAGTLHVDHYGERGALLLQIELNTAEPFTQNIPWDWFHAGVHLQPFLSLARLFGTGHCSDSKLIEATMNVLHSFRPAAARTTSVPQWLQRIRNVVLAAPSRGMIRVEHLAAQTGIHPVYLTRQFRRHFGETIRGCISRLRVQSAAQFIADSNRKFADIACDLGYADQAHFCREFRNYTGISPGELRHLARQ